MAVRKSYVRECTRRGGTEFPPPVRLYSRTRSYSNIHVSLILFPGVHAITAARDSKDFAASFPSTWHRAGETTMPVAFFRRPALEGQCLHVPCVCTALSNLHGSRNLAPGCQKGRTHNGSSQAEFFCFVLGKGIHFSIEASTFGGVWLAIANAIGKELKIHCVSKQCIKIQILFGSRL
jgi:hypothetical protein